MYSRQCSQAVGGSGRRAAGVGMACPRRNRSSAIPISDRVPLPAPCPSQLLQTLWGLAPRPRHHCSPMAALWWGEGGSPPLAGARGTHTGPGVESTRMGTEDIGAVEIAVRPLLRARPGQVGVPVFLEVPVFFAQTSVNNEILVGTQ